MVAKFYDELKKKNKVEILLPDKPLIKVAIEEKTANKTDEKIKAEDAQKSTSTAQTNNKSNGKRNVKGGNAKAPAKPAKAQQSAKEPAAKKQPAKKPQAEQARSAGSNGQASKNRESINLGGSSGRGTKRGRNVLMTSELGDDDIYTARAATHNLQQDAQVHTEKTV